MRFGLGATGFDAGCGDGCGGCKQVNRGKGRPGRDPSGQRGCCLHKAAQRHPHADSGSPQEPCNVRPGLQGEAA